MPLFIGAAFQLIPDRSLPERHPQEVGGAAEHVRRHRSGQKKENNDQQGELFDSLEGSAGSGRGAGSDSVTMKELGRMPVSRPNSFPTLFMGRSRG